MSNARDKANIPSLNFSSTGIDDNATSTAITIDSNEQVGIGTSSPAVPLHVNSGTVNSVAIFESSDADSVVWLKDSGGSMNLDSASGNLIFNIGYDTSFSGGSEAMRIDSSGNVGIGTSSPSGTLDVVSSGTNNQGMLELSSASGVRTTIATDAQDDGLMYLYDNTSSIKVAFRTDGNASYINGGGNVGIGTSSPGSPLTVSGGTNSTVANINNNVSTTTSLSTVLLLQSNTTGSAGVGFGLSMGFNGERNDGNTQRFGTLSWEANTNSSTNLKTDCVISLYSGHEVLRLKQTSVGSQNEMIAPDLLTTGTTSNRYPLYWVHNGTVGSIQPYTGSIREMKTDINDMGSVDWIHSLRPRSFKFRDFETNEDGSKTYLETTDNEPNTEYGLIAEEVNEVSGSDYILDKQTDEDGNENLKGVLYHNLVPVLLKAVQEQKNTIQELEARITALETTTP